MKLPEQTKADEVLERISGIFFFDPVGGTNHGSGTEGALGYFERWRDYNCSQFLMHVYRESEFSESIVDGLLALAVWDKLALVEGKTLLESANAAAQWLVNRWNRRWRSPYESINVKWVEKDDLAPQHGDGYFAYVNYDSDEMGNAAAEITSRPLEANGRRFCVEMLLHECRHIYQGLFVRIPSAKEMRAKAGFKNREFDSPWERDARLYQYLVATLFYDGTATLDKDEKIVDRDVLRLGWRWLREIVEYSWDRCWNEEDIDHARVSINFAAEAAAGNPATKLVPILLQEKLVDLVWLSRAHGVVGGLVQHSKPSGVTRTLWPAYSFYIENVPKRSLPGYDPELDAEIFVHQAYLWNRIGLALRPGADESKRDEARKIFKHATHWALNAFEATGNVRYLKYVADNLAILGELEVERRVILNDLAERTFALGYALRYLATASVDYVVDKIAEKLTTVHAGVIADGDCTLEITGNANNRKLYVASLTLDSVQFQGAAKRDWLVTKKKRIERFISSGAIRDMAIAGAVLQHHLAKMNLLFQGTYAEDLELKYLSSEEGRNKMPGIFPIVFARVLSFGQKINALSPNSYNFNVRVFDGELIRRRVDGLRQVLEGSEVASVESQDGDILKILGIDADPERWRTVLLAKPKLQGRF